MPIIIERRDVNQAQTINPNLPMTGGVQPGQQQTGQIQPQQPIPQDPMRPQIQPRTFGTNDGGQMNQPFDAMAKYAPVTPQQQQQSAMLGAVVPQLGQANLEQNPGVMTQAKVAPQITPLQPTTTNPYQKNAQEQAALNGQTVQNGAVNPQQRQQPLSEREQLAQLQAQEAELMSSDPQDQNGRWKSFLYALVDRLKNFQMIPGANGKFDWGNLAASLAPVLGGGVGALVNPAYDEQQARNENLGKNRSKQQVLSARIETNQKRAKADLDIQNEQAQLQGRMYDNLDKKTRQLYDSVNSDEIITEEEAAMLRRETGKPFQAVDNRKFKVEDRNGVQFATNEKGVPDYKPVPSLKADMSKTRREYTFPNGAKAKLTESEIATYEGTKAQADANRMQAALMNNNNNEETYNREKTKYEETTGTLRGEVEASNATISALDGEITQANSDLEAANTRYEAAKNAKMTDEDGNEIPSAKREFEDAKREREKVKDRIFDLKKQRREADATRRRSEQRLKSQKPPVRTSNVNPVTTSNVPIMTEKEFRARNAKSKRPLNETELQVAIQAERSKGRITD